MLMDSDEDGEDQEGRRLARTIAPAVWWCVGVPPPLPAPLPPPPALLPPWCRGATRSGRSKKTAWVYGSSHQSAGI